VRAPPAAFQLTVQGRCLCCPVLQALQHQHHPQVAPGSANEGAGTQRWAAEAQTATHMQPQSSPHTLCMIAGSAWGNAASLSRNRHPSNSTMW